MARILVADDDADILALVVQRLRHCDHTVQGVGDAAAALAFVVERGAPDLVILDVTMPGMDGLELLRRLRVDTGVEDLPAIFLSGRMRPADIEAGRALGGRYLTKPYIATALIAAVDDVITGIEMKAAEARGDSAW
jgi:CheY-like chemotaxis protein